VSGHVLVIGVDGTRFDALGAETTPAIWAVGSRGFLTPVIIDEATPTWSGPCWANIATGVPVAMHGIGGNDLTGHRLAAHPDFLTVATRAGFSTLLAVSGWPPLAVAQDGGPLFAEASRREFVPVTEEYSTAAWDAADEAVTELTASVIAADGPRACFAYLGAVDITGHIDGVAATYRAAVHAADQRVARLIAATRSRPAGEDWTIVVVTDHGHVDDGGHGGREPAVVTAWVAASGPGAQRAVTSHLDIAPLVLSCLLSERAVVPVPWLPEAVTGGDGTRLNGSGRATRDRRQGSR
jgi:hypothetical protein